MMTQLGAFCFRHRNALFPFVFLLVLTPGPSIFDDALHATGAGFVMAGMGQILRCMTIGLEYIVRGGRKRRAYADGLVTGGLYAHCRNPMYVGNMLILVGMSIASNSWSCLLLAVPLFTFVYVAIVASEEAYLRDKFGAEFEEYAAAVPRWLPRLRDARTTLARSQFRWRRIVVKEYGTPFGWLMGLPALALWNLWRAESLVPRRTAVELLIASMLLTLTLWAIIRALKKSHALVAD